ncbi:winged helix DNA-binding domain-containing protein [Georgenia sp. Z1491]|uniref:winged helix DNA-binding domain-containing protein n=1 Tax=Georgenia sp. Z1491 TaxID=3416707 RepID=UPI003CFA6872
MTTRVARDRARRIRFDAHLLGGSTLSPTEVVDRAVALQGQDLPAVLRAIAIRSRPGTTLDDVRAAFDAGAIVRSWPMRGTLFATTPEHLATLLSLTAERIQRADGPRREALGLDAHVMSAAREVLLDALAERPHTRAEVLEMWNAAGIATESGRGYHLIAHLAIDGHAHWGAFTDDGAEQLFTHSSTAPSTGSAVTSSSALDGPADRADPDRTLARILRGYVAARGPVTAADLAWWTKLPKTHVLRAATLVDDLVEVDVAGATAWVLAEMLDGDRDGDARTARPTGPTGDVTLVPAFDEWLLGYQDRSLVASPAMLDAVVPGRNGVFRPTILVDGVVVGTWRIPASRGSRPAAPVVELVERVPARTRKSVDAALSAWPHR